MTERLQSLATEQGNLLSATQKREVLVIPALKVLNGSGSEIVPMDEVTPQKPKDKIILEAEGRPPVDLLAANQHLTDEDLIKQIETSPSSFTRQFYQNILDARRRKVSPNASLEQVDFSHLATRTQEVQLEATGLSKEQLAQNQEQESVATQSEVQIDMGQNAHDEAMVKYMAMNPLERAQYVIRRNAMLNKKGGSLDEPLESVAMLDNQLKRWKEKKALSIFKEAKEQGKQLNLATFLEKMDQFKIPPAEAAQLFAKGPVEVAPLSKSETGPLKEIFNKEIMKGVNQVFIDNFFLNDEKGKYSAAVRCLLGVWRNLQKMKRDADREGQYQRMAEVNLIINDFDKVAKAYVLAHRVSFRAQSEYLS
ncbi:MAG TPA: hypothetical protein VF209_03870 [Patescibacteria group bacterium]